MQTTRMIWGVMAVLLFVVAVSTRLAVLYANYDAYQGDLPFTLESALQFRNTERVYRGEGIPAWDPMIEYPEGISVFRTDTVLAEYVYGGLARVLPSTIPLERRVRWMMVFWFSLSIPLMALWVSAWTRSRSAGVVAGLFYAVSLAAVIRSSGIEMSRENFSIPFLMGHLWCHALGWSAREQTASRRAAIGSALCLGMALATWDMIQFYVLGWALFLAVEVCRPARWERDSVRRLWLYPALALCVVAVWSPYHRAHGLWASPALWVVYGVGLLQAFDRRRRWPVYGRVSCLLLPLCAYLLIPHGYGESYHHFTELLGAKLRFLNQKPMDPSVLTFNQRIMWVPALDSATFLLTRILFPAMLPILTWSVLLFSARAALRRGTCARMNPLTVQQLFFVILSFISFVLFVRFHVFLALFGAAWLGWWWSGAMQAFRAGRVFAAGFVSLALLAGWVLEAAQVWADPGRWGRPNTYYAEVQELTDWLRREIAPAPVLANFGVSGSILAYGHCPIVLHPKFETAAIRERVAAYGRHLFKQNEEAFRDWVDAHGATYYVYAVGEFATRSPELQMRYFVDALEPPPDAAARVFEFEPDRVRYFEYVWGNRKYRVFRVISRDDEARADMLTLRARQAWEKGDVEQAEAYAWAALALFPAQYHARELIAQITAVLPDDAL